VTAEFASEKHQPETRRTRDGFETSLAEFTLRAIARDGRSTVWTIKCLRLHSF